MSLKRHSKEKWDKSMQNLTQDCMNRFSKLEMKKGTSDSKAEV